MEAYDPTTTRRMWHHIEPVHAVFYFAPEVVSEAAALGYDTRTRWPSYFAWRAAPLGAAGTKLVTATFHSFSPAMVAEHVPAAWAVASPERVLEARLVAVDKMFRAQLGDEVGSAGMREAAELAKRAAEATDTAGRPLAAANADLPWPDEPHLRLWQALTILREHRGDGHVATLLAAGLDGCEALVSFAAIGAAPVETFASRGWTTAEWEAAAERLAERGWIDADGKATDLGREAREDIERRTDELAAGPWKSLGAERSERLIQLLLPALSAALNAGLFPPQTTLGIGRIPEPTWA